MKITKLLNTKLFENSILALVRVSSRSVRYFPTQSSRVLQWIYSLSGDRIASHQTPLDRADRWKEDKRATTAKRESKGNGILIYHRVFHGFWINTVLNG